jgi:acyl carrier protein
VYEQVEVLLADVLQIPVASITDDLAMNDTDPWDSLRHMELVVSLEHAYGLEFSFDDIVAMRTVGDIKRVLRERGV